MKFNRANSRIAPRLFRLALRANAKDFQRVRHVRVAHLARDSLERIRHAKVDHLHLTTRTANDVVMVMIGEIDFVSVRPVSEVASPHDVEFLHRRKATIHRDEITFAMRQLSENLLGAEGAMFRDQHRQDRFARPGDPLAIRAQTLEGNLQLMLGRRVMMMIHREQG
jgi:hypothetical protein